MPPYRALCFYLFEVPRGPHKVPERGFTERGHFLGYSPQEGVAVFPGVGTPRISFVLTQTPSIGLTAPSMVIQSPSFPSGFPPPRGIGDSPRIMHDKRECDTHAYRGALT